MIDRNTRQPSVGIDSVTAAIFNTNCLAFVKKLMAVIPQHPDRRPYDLTVKTPHCHDLCKTRSQ